MMSHQWRIQGRGRHPLRPPQLAPLFLDLKKFFGLPLSKRLDDRVPSHPLISRSGSGTGHYLYLDLGRE